MANKVLLGAGAYAHFNKSNTSSQVALVFTNLNTLFNEQFEVLDNKLSDIITMYNKFCDEQLDKNKKEDFKISIDESTDNLIYRQELEHIKEQLNPIAVKENLLTELTEMREKLKELEDNWVD